MTAWNRVIKDDPTARRAVEAATEIGEPAQAVARAVVANMLGRAFEAGLPLLDGGRRDALVDQLVDDWHARVAGVGAFLLDSSETWQPLWRLRSSSGAVVLSQRAPIQRPGTSCAIRLEASRFAHTFASPSSIWTTTCTCLRIVSAASPASICWGRNMVPRVKGLITVGSQAPYLHEIGGLWGLAPGTAELPSHFPPWLNLYDPYDFLSYVVAPVFQRGVWTCGSSPDNPFRIPIAGDWTNAQTWNAIRAFAT